MAGLTVVASQMVNVTTDINHGVTVPPNGFFTILGDNVDVTGHVLLLKTTIVVFLVGKHTAPRTIRRYLTLEFSATYNQWATRDLNL